MHIPVADIRFCSRIPLSGLPCKRHAMTSPEAYQEINMELNEGGAGGPRNSELGGRVDVY